MKLPGRNVIVVVIIALLICVGLILGLPKLKQLFGKDDTKSDTPMAEKVLEPMTEPLTTQTNILNPMDGKSIPEIVPVPDANYNYNNGNPPGQTGQPNTTNQTTPDSSVYMTPNQAKQVAGNVEYYQTQNTLLLKEVELLKNKVAYLEQKLTQPNAYGSNNGNNGQFKSWKPNGNNAMPSAQSMAGKKVIVLDGNKANVYNGYPPSMTQKTPSQAAPKKYIAKKKYKKPYKKKYKKTYKKKWKKTSYATKKNKASIKKLNQDIYNLKKKVKHLENKVWQLEN